MLPQQCGSTIFLKSQAPVTLRYLWLFLDIHPVACIDWQWEQRAESSCLQVANMKRNSIAKLVCSRTNLSGILRRLGAMGRIHVTLYSKVGTGRLVLRTKKVPRYYYIRVSENTSKNDETTPVPGLQQKVALPLLNMYSTQSRMTQWPTTPVRHHITY